MSSKILNLDSREGRALVAGITPLSSLSMSAEVVGRDLGPGLEHLSTRLTSLLDDFEKKKTTIERDPDLATPGKQKLLEKLSAEASAKVIDHTKSAVDAVREKLKAFGAENGRLTTAALGRDPSVTKDESALRKLDLVRQHLLGLNTEELHTAVVDASTKDPDSFVMVALDDAPHIIRKALLAKAGIDESAMIKLRGEYRSRVDPARHRHLNDLAEISEHVRSNSRSSFDAVSRGHGSASRLPDLDVILAGLGS